MREQPPNQTKYERKEQKRDGDVFGHHLLHRLVWMGEEPQDRGNDAVAKVDNSFHKHLEKTRSRYRSRQYQRSQIKIANSASLSLRKMVVTKLAVANFVRSLPETSLAVGVSQETVVRS